MKKTHCGSKHPIVLISLILLFGMVSASGFTQSNKLSIGIGGFKNASTSSPEDYAGYSVYIPVRIFHTLQKKDFNVIHLDFIRAKLMKKGTSWADYYLDTPYIAVSELIYTDMIIFGSYTNRLEEPRYLVQAIVFDAYTGETINTFESSHSLLMDYAIDDLIEQVVSFLRSYKKK